MTPRLMLFDEVTSALDPELVGEVLGRATRPEAGRHDHAHRDARDGLRAARSPTRCASSTDGVIVERGGPDQVIHAPQDPRTQEFLRRVHEAGRL